MTAFGNASTQQKQDDKLLAGYSLPQGTPVKPKPILGALDEILSLQPSVGQSPFPFAHWF